MTSPHKKTSASCGETVGSFHNQTTHSI